MEEIFGQLIADNVPLVTSTITFEEYLVHPYRTKQAEKAQAFFDFVEDANIEVININKDIAKLAAHIRADYLSFHAMDALQLATALKCNCDGFLTNDKRLRSFTKTKCLIVDEC